MAFRTRKQQRRWRAANEDNMSKSHGDIAEITRAVVEGVKALPPPQARKDRPGVQVPYRPEDFTPEQHHLLAMLAYQRPHNSKGELDFIGRFIHPVMESPTVLHWAYDEYGNIIACTDTASRTLFSCHTDTVHPRPHPDYRNKLQCHSLHGRRLICTDGTSQLGADNAVGIWVMLRMITAGVPGWYVFHRAEEVGGKGSSWIAKATPEFLAGFDRAIAFDRKDTSSVITHQSWFRCCSDAFAKALCEALGSDGLDAYTPDDSGVFTDTANYTDHIPECTNISAGYWQEHTFHEYLDIEYATRLLARCLRVDWEALPTVRKAGEVDYEDDLECMQGWQYYRDTAAEKKRKASKHNYMDITTVKLLIREFPDEAAELLLDYLGTADAVQDDLTTMHYRELLS